jgi:magnesium-transporting ATPase (P-type)
MKIKSHKRLLFLIDIVIITISVCWIGWLRELPYIGLIDYQNKILIFAISWLSLGSLGKKFTLAKYDNLKAYTKQIIGTNALYFGFASLILFLYKYHFSRFLLLGTIISTTVLELVFFNTIHMRKNPRKDKAILRSWLRYLSFICGDFFLFIAVFLALAIWKPATINYVLPKYIRFAIYGGFGWVLFSILNHKYRAFRIRDRNLILRKVIFVDFGILLLCTTLMYITKHFYISRFLTFGTLVITTCLDIGIAWLISQYWKYEDLAPERIARGWVVEYDESNAENEVEKISLKKDV